MTQLFFSMDLVDDPSSSNLSAVFEIPGVKLNGLSLQINNGSLVVRGERRPPYNITTSLRAAGPHAPIDSASGNASATGFSQNDNQSPSFPVQELYFGDFYRSIPLPVGIKVIVHLLTRHLFPLLSFMNDSFTTFL
jgi:HSP20 family molecular chaperone IbpA